MTVTLPEVASGHVYLCITWEGDEDYTNSLSMASSLAAATLVQPGVLEVSVLHRFAGVSRCLAVEIVRSTLTKDEEREALRTAAKGELT